MIYSMTGFGKAKFELNNNAYAIEVKSLNSKQADIYMRLPSLMKEMEIALRKTTSDALKRGKIEITINELKQGDSNSYVINKELLLSYYNEVKALNLPSENIIGALLKLPNILVAQDNELSEKDKQLIENALIEACNDLNVFRLQEGEVLAKDLKLRIDNIMQHKAKIEVLAPQRIDRIRNKMLDGLKALTLELDVKSDRLEQEMIFYIEKLDVTEEFVRLDGHCDYFLEVMESDEEEVGKKLNFISQEIGREINTLGSKANDADIQKHVVQMKDELEKIKEQVNNVM